MKKESVVLNTLIQSCKDHVLSHTLFGLELNGEFERTIPIIEKFNGEEHTAYGSGTFKLMDSTVCIFNTYGDEDQEEHYDEQKDKNISSGYCFNIDGYFYCFDVMENGDIVRLMKSSESLTFDPMIYASKRSFYHYRTDKKLSMSGYYAGVGSEHEEARRWTSGPRTFFELVPFTQDID